jgi:ubiquinone/menaquinone biosynthesis C-methylase UbiE
MSEVGQDAAPSTDFETAAGIRRALAPSNEQIARARFSSNEAVAGELLRGKGKRALDVGCGDGKFTRVLAGLFERVDGIDVNERRVAAAQKAAQAAGLPIQFRAGSGETLPFADGSIDVVVFSNSLHHMADVDRALREAARVLVPNGLLYVMEPVPAGSYFEAAKLVSDETAVRTEAYRAIGRMLRSGFVPIAELMYRSRREFADFAEWRADQIETSESRRAIFAVRGDEVRRHFEAAAERSNGRLAFEQIRRVNLLRKAATPT